MARVEIEDVAGPEWADWYRMARLMTAFLRDTTIAELSRQSTSTSIGDHR